MTLKKCLHKRLGLSIYLKFQVHGRDFNWKFPNFIRQFLMFTMLNYKGILNGQAKFECQLSSYRAPVVGHSYSYRTVALREI